MEFSSRALKYMQFTLVALLVLTIGLLVWHRYGMERVYEFSAEKQSILSGGDDRAQGGLSEGKVVSENGVIKMTCKIVKKIDWPFCQMMFPLGDGARGKDLSAFDYVTFDVSFKGPGRHAIRHSMMNFEPGISRVDDWMSPKINELEFDIPAQGEVRIPLNIYRTAQWWIDQRKVPIEQSGTNIDNVVRMEVLTGNYPAEGEHEIVIRSIKFHGKWLSKSQLLGILVGAWILAAIAWPAYAALQMRLQLRASRQRLALLGEINKALQLETKELVGQAHIDPLTGALNRQGLRAAMMSTSTLLADPMSIIFVDIDHFKRINDQHGHEVGDAVLRDFAATIGCEIRGNDKLVRWGGEEFLIICPSTSADQGYQLATKLRLAMPNHRWPVGLRVTASFGVASLGKSEDIGAVIKRADTALYKAKANGRDRVEVSMDEELAAV